MPQHGLRSLSENADFASNHFLTDSLLGDNCAECLNRESTMPGQTLAVKFWCVHHCHQHGSTWLVCGSVHSMIRAKITGQTFHAPQGCTIGKLDGYGNVVLVVDPTTLPPEISAALSRLGISGTIPEKTRGPSLGLSLYSSDQSRAEHGR